VANARARTAPSRNRQRPRHFPISCPIPNPIPSPSPSPSPDAGGSAFAHSASGVSATALRGGGSCQTHVGWPPCSNRPRRNARRRSRGRQRACMNACERLRNCARCPPHVRAPPPAPEITGSDPSHVSSERIPQCTGLAVWDTTNDAEPLRTMSARSIPSPRGRIRENPSRLAATWQPGRRSSW
jgi:hypothetical protein